MPNRIQLDIRGLTYTLPINPIEFQAQFSIQNSLEDTIANSTMRFTTFRDNRHRVMTWRNLENKYPYTQLISGLRTAIGISGVRMKQRDLDITGDQDEWIGIFVEDVRVVFRKGLGKSTSINKLSYDIEMIYTLR